MWGDWNDGGTWAFLATDSSWPDLAWFGARTGYFRPVLLKSTNKGRSWVRVDAGSSAFAHFSVAVDPADSARVFSGMSGRVVRTTDGAGSWETVLSGTAPFMLGVAVSALHPGWVFAAGAGDLESPDPRPLVLHVSVDGGETWEAIVNESVQYGGVLSMRLVKNGDAETLFLGTDDGVYAFTANPG